VQPTCPPANDTLMELLVMVHAGARLPQESRQLCRTSATRARTGDRVRPVRRLPLAWLRT
jgi:hypothetical protein